MEKNLNRKNNNDKMIAQISKKILYLYVEYNFAIAPLHTNMVQKE